MQHLKNMLLILATFTTSSIISTTINLDPYFTGDPYAKDADNRSMEHISALYCDLPNEEWKNFSHEFTVRNEAYGQKYGMPNKKISLARMEPDNNGETPEQIAEKKFNETGNPRCFMFFYFFKGVVHGLNIKD